MKSLVLVLLFHLLLICSKCNKVINIASHDPLSLYLCHHYNYTGDTTLLLLDTVYNISGNGSLCTINTNYSLTIESNQSMATIKCISYTYVNTTHPTIGFAFTGSSSLTLQRVTFRGCGATLSTLDKEQLNINSTSSLVYFTQYHAAVLVFTNINQLVMKEVTIFQYYGFAIVAVNLPNGTLDSINVVSYQVIQVVSQSNHSVGSGVLILYKNLYSNLSQYQVKITDSLFALNYEYIVYPGLMCATDFYNSSIYKISPKPVINAAGLTILYTQNDTKAQVNISRCTFTGNIGSIAGAMLVLHLNTQTHSRTIICNHSVFMTNNMIQKCPGSGIVFIMFFDQASRRTLTSSHNKMYHPLLIAATTFTFHIHFLGVLQESLMHIVMINANELSIRLSLFNITYEKNLALSIIAVVYPPKENNIQLDIISVKVLRNNIPNKHGRSFTFLSPVSLFYLSNLNTIRIGGSSQNPSIFAFNYGTVIQAIRSDITLKGHIVFHNNTGINGAAIMLIGDSLIHLNEGLQANFTNNKALSSGGAIYAQGNTYGETYCKFQINPSHYKKILVLFENNKATITGNAVYSSKLYNCYMGKHFITSKMAVDIYRKIFTFIPRDTYPISTTPVNLTICDSHNPIMPYSADAYPGQKINFSMAAIDAVGNHSYSVITVAAVKNTNIGFIPINWWFSEREDTQVIRESKQCTLINVTIHTNDHSTLDAPHGALLFAIPSITDIKIVRINLKSCPPGFELNNITGSCTCSQVLLNINGYTPNCSINTRTFNRPTFTSWAGSVQVNSTFRFLLSLYCHHEYCNSDPILTNFHYSNRDKKFEIFSKDLSFNSSLCLDNREGILCGNCSTNYSVVFGSTECRQCSNWWLWTLVLYAVAGPLLIYLLYVLRLTLTTGTFNGIIFYAQAANVGILDMLSVYNGKMGVMRRISIVLLSVLNLGLGFPLCFYNGMTELWKAGFSLLFPLYLLTIVVALIILSHFSLRLSNKIAHSSVQVLVTVVHLSFGKLLGSIIDVFTPAKVFTSEQTYHVWYWDGSVEYGSKGHITLMVITSLIVFPLILPYALLLFAKPLRHWTCANEYTRPIIEAIHAPYKNGKQYWFVARLLLLIMMYVLYSIEPYAQVIYIAIASVLFLFIIGQAMFRPYKSNFINLLDCWILFNLGFVYITIWYLGHMEVTVYSKIAILLFFMTIFIVLAYHILFITGQIKKMRKKITDINIKKGQLFSHFNRKYQYNGNKRSRRLPLQDANDSFYESCDNYREPLLFSNN